MADYAEILGNLIQPIVDEPESLSITEAAGENPNVIVLTVTAKSSDIGRLIGRKGSMASALRQVMSVASHTENKRVSIQFVELDGEEASTLTDGDKTVEILGDEVESTSVAE